MRAGAFAAELAGHAGHVDALDRSPAMIAAARQVRQHAAAVLPGVRVRRLVYWRYLLVWQRPTDNQAGAHRAG
jgi:hypothetical protein